MVPPEPLITASIETAPADKAPSVAPLVPPKADLTDPYQRRASAVGLHPDISRALLTRLSSADFRNARVAIETAVAKTPDAGTFVWPSAPARAGAVPSAFCSRRGARLPALRGNGHQGPLVDDGAADGTVWRRAGGAQGLAMTWLRP